MECLDLRIVEFKVERAYLPNSYQCGWAWPVISMDFKVKLYVKYKIYRWTYHDRMHIKVRAKKTHPNYFNIGERDFCIIEDKNPSDNAVVKEKIIEKTLSYYDFGGSFKGEDYRNSGWRKWHIGFFTDSGGPVKAIDLSGYWDASTCKFTQFKVEGDIEQPPSPPPQPPSPPPSQCPFNTKEEVYKYVCNFLKSNPSKQSIFNEIIHLTDIRFKCDNASGEVKYAIDGAVADLTNLYKGKVSFDSLIAKYCGIPAPERKIILSADRMKISEGETVKFTADVYGVPGTSVKTCVYVEGVRKECYWVSLDDYGHGVLKFNVTFPSYGTYHVKACVVNPITNEPAYCSNEVTITVERKVELPKPKINRDYTRLVWNGHYYTPGTYKVPKGTKVLASMSIRNEGGDGRVRVVIWDSYKGEAVYKEDMDMHKGQGVDFGRTFTVDRNYAIKIITYYYDPADGKFKKYDEYG